MPTIKGVEVTERQAEVYRVMRSVRRPVADHALVPLAQHMSSVHQSSSGIRSRRAELTQKGLVIPTGSTTTGSGRKAVVYRAV
jgi:hypothetical protein